MTPFNIVFFLTFLLPFFVFPFGPYFFESPKVIVAEIAIDILFILRVFINRGEAKVLFHKINPVAFGAIGAVLLFTIISCLAIPDSQSFFGNPIRLQGIFLLWHLLIFSLLSADIKLDKQIKLFYLIYFLIFSATVLVVALLGINQNGRAVGTLGDPNSLAAATIFFLPFLWLKGNLPVKILALVLGLGVVIFSGSRSGLLAFGLEGIFLLLSNIKFLGVVKSALIVLIILGIGLFLPFIEGGGWFENRAEIWQTAALAGLKAPILGNGFGNIKSVLKETSVGLGNNLQYQIVDSSHNVFLDYWVQGGIWGIIFLLTILIISISSFIKTGNKLLITLSIGLLTVLSFNPLSVVVLLMFWWVLGQGFLKQDQH